MSTSPYLTSPSLNLLALSCLANTDKVSLSSAALLLIRMSISSLHSKFF